MNFPKSIDRRLSLELLLLTDLDRVRFCSFLGCFDLFELSRGGTGHVPGVSEVKSWSNVPAGNTPKPSLTFLILVLAMETG